MQRLFRESPKPSEKMFSSMADFSRVNVFWWCEAFAPQAVLSDFSAIQNFKRIKSRWARFFRIATFHSKIIWNQIDFHPEINFQLAENHSDMMTSTGVNRKSIPNRLQTVCKPIATPLQLKCKPVENTVPTLRSPLRNCTLSLRRVGENHEKVEILPDCVIFVKFGEQHEVGKDFLQKLGNTVSTRVGTARSPVDPVGTASIGFNPRVSWESFENQLEFTS